MLRSGTIESDTWITTNRAARKATETHEHVRNFLVWQSVNIEKSAETAERDYVKAVPYEYSSKSQLKAHLFASPKFSPDNYFYSPDLKIIRKWRHGERLARALLVSLAF
jgi:hypothetical protein